MLFVGSYYSRFFVKKLNRGSLELLDRFVNSRRRMRDLMKYQKSVYLILLELTEIFNFLLLTGQVLKNFSEFTNIIDKFGKTIY